MINHEILRLQIKLACACNNDIKIKHFAEYIDINENSFYNYMSGYYNISESKARKLQDIVVDLIDY